MAASGNFVQNMRSTLVSLFAGLLFGGAWLALVDGIVQSHYGVSTIPFWWYYALPAVFVSICAICMNFTDWSQLKPIASGAGFDLGGGDDASVTGQRCAVAWFIVMFAGCFACVGGSIWIFVQDFASDGWPGISLLVQTSVVTTSGLLFFFARGPSSSQGGEYGVL
jgi:hypothetical protein